MMNANSVPATSAAAANFDLPSLSSSTFLSAQQTAAPFSQLLQQAQSPPAPPPPAPPPPSPPPPPQRSSNQGAANSDGNQSGAGSTTNSGSTTKSNTPASDNAAPPSQSDASASDTSAANTTNQTDQNSSGAQSARQADAANHTAKGGGRGKSSGKSTGDDRHDVTAATAESTTAEANVAAASAKALTSDKGGKQSKNDSDSSDTSKKSDGTADSGSVATEAPVTAPPPAPTVALVAALPATAPIVPDENGKAAADATATSSEKQLVKGVRVASATIKAQSPITPGPIKSKPQTGKTPVSPNTSAEAGRAQTAAQESNAVAPPVAPQGRAPADAPPAAQPPTTAGDADSTSSAAATAVQTIATVAANQAQAVSTITIDPSTSSAAKPEVSFANAPSTPPPSTAVEAPPTTTSSTVSPMFTAAPSHSAPLEPAAGSGLSTLDRARFVQRVSRAFQAAGDQGGQIRLRLSPPELGSLQMQISVKQGAMTAQIQTDNSTAQQVLLDNLPELRDRLAQQDIRIDRFEVEVSGQSSGGLPQSPQGNPDLDQTGRRLSAARSAPMPAVAENTEPTRVASTLSSVALNVVV